MGTAHASLAAGANSSLASGASRVVPWTTAWSRRWRAASACLCRARSLRSAVATRDGAVFFGAAFARAGGFAAARLCTLCASLRHGMTACFRVGLAGATEFWCGAAARSASGARSGEGTLGSVDGSVGSSAAGCSAGSADGSAGGAMGRKLPSCVSSSVACGGSAAALLAFSLALAAVSGTSCHHAG